MPVFTVYSLRKIMFSGGRYRGSSSRHPPPSKKMVHLSRSICLFLFFGGWVLSGTTLAHMFAVGICVIHSSRTKYDIIAAITGSVDR